MDVKYLITLQGAPGMVLAVCTLRNTLQTCDLCSSAAAYELVPIGDNGADITYQCGGCVSFAMSASATGRTPERWFAPVVQP